MSRYYESIKVADEKKKDNMIKFLNEMNRVKEELSQDIENLKASLESAEKAKSDLEKELTSQIASLEKDKFSLEEKFLSLEDLRGRNEACLLSENEEAEQKFFRDVSYLREELTLTEEDKKRIEKDLTAKIVSIEKDKSLLKTKIESFKKLRIKKLKKTVENIFNKIPIPRINPPKNKALLILLVLALIWAISEIARFFIARR